MANRTSQLVKPDRSRPGQGSNEAGFLPLAIAGVFCFFLAVAMGTVAAYIFWATQKPVVLASAAPEAATQIPEPEPPTAQPSVESAAPVEEPTGPPSGTVLVAAGEHVFSGDSKRPIQRVMVGEFAISETEVTNAEYAEFVKETGYESPSGWNGADFPSGAADFPVVNVSWKDAVEFCKWKSTKLGLPVRLPTEAEWERAARGSDGLKYPWGSEWNGDAAVSKETGGKTRAVKASSANRSPYGAYDMVGNVWEWISNEVGETDVVSDSHVESARKEGQQLRIVKGGSAEESSSEMNAQSRYEVPDNTKVKVIGFRYVVSLADRK